MPKMLSADLLDCSANCCISEATTAKPLPASPALAASMLAFNDSRLVWSAMEEIRDAASSISFTESFVRVICWAMRWIPSVMLLLERLSALRIVTASSLACFMLMEVSSSSAISASMLSISSPRLTISLVEVSTSRAWFVAPSAISEIAASICSEVCSEPCEIDSSSAPLFFNSISHCFTFVITSDSLSVILLRERPKVSNSSPFPVSALTVISPSEICVSAPLNFLMLFCTEVITKIVSSTTSTEPTMNTA